MKMNNRRTALAAVAVTVAFLSAGCAPLLVGGAVAGGAMVASDRRSPGIQLEDQAIELRLSNAMAFDATIQGTWGCRPELYPDAVRLVTSGRVTLKPFIERHPLGDGVEILRRVADHEIHKRAILVPNGNA